MRAVVDQQAARLAALDDRRSRAWPRTAATSARTIAAPVPSPRGMDDAAAASARPRGRARSCPAASRSKRDAEACEPRDRVGRRVGERADDRGIAEPGASRQRVGGVQRRRVVLAQRGGDAALRPGRGGALGRSGVLASRIDAAAARAAAPSIRPATPPPMMTTPARSERTVSIGCLVRPPASARPRGARARRRPDRSSTSCCMVSSARRILGRVMRFMCGQRLQGRTNSMLGMCERRRCRSSSTR